MFQHLSEFDSNLDSLKFQSKMKSKENILINNPNNEPSVEYNLLLEILTYINLLSKEIYVSKESET